MNEKKVPRCASCHQCQHHEEMLGGILGRLFVSPNVIDSNSEPANLVDVGYQIAQGLHHIAEAIADHAKSTGRYYGRDD